MRVGLLTPVVTRLPGQHGDWEATATPDDLADVVVAAEEVGLAHVTCSHHAVVPTQTATVRGGTYWDPLATLSFLAARTRTIRLVTNVLVLGYQHPVLVAKQYATLDRLSGGRVVLGVGVGSLEEEFDLLDVPFSDRGTRADDALRELRRALDHGVPGFVLDPAPVQARVPVWVGGRSARSLRRALELGDGWVPFGRSLADLQTMLGAQELPNGFEVVLSPSRPLDPAGDPAGVARVLDRLEAAGATAANVALAADTKDGYVAQLKALAQHLP